MSASKEDLGEVVSENRERFLDAAEQLRNSHYSQVLVVGYSDSSGGLIRNFLLSSKRASIVAARLEAELRDAKSKPSIIHFGRGEAFSLEEAKSPIGLEARRVDILGCSLPKIPSSAEILRFSPDD